MASFKHSPDAPPNDAAFAAFASLQADVALALVGPLARLVLLVMSGALELDKPLQSFCEKSGMKRTGAASGLGGEAHFLCAQPLRRAS